ncbi:MAG: PTS sugar transporter subunit IIA [Planctomycetes bacterium]|nr:PTS sugar transporter subunit IIA [Planctomycetota bacterium]
MSHDDLDLNGVAEYLHLSPAQVQRLVERGNLPARRVAGQWRFSRAELREWLEHQIGLSNEAELQRMDEAFDRDLAAADSEPRSVAEMLPLAAIAIPLAARTRASVIAGMIELAAGTGWLWDTAAMTEAVQQREDLCPTALDNGVAMLHARRPLPAVLEQPFICLGRTETGIPFGNARMTDIFFLICSTSDRGHLHTLARLSRVVNDDSFLQALREAPDAALARELIVVREQSLLA